ncbi:MAG: class I fructose-bisphosphate aldolase family protein [archaeon]|nr:class I fructose-bisphosphate aldolase family protein [archaeon]
MSSYIGKKIRLERITNRETGNTIIVPMDHGMTVGPIAGLSDMGKMVDMVAEGGANAVLGHVGLPIYGHRQHGKDIGLLLHINASSVLSTDKDNKVLVNTIEEAIRIGADGVSIHINIGGKDDSNMIKILGDISRGCRKWGMPLLAMMYPRGENIKDDTDVENVKFVARIGAEMGADIIKTNWTGDPDSFKEVVKGCMAPIVIAGGEKKGNLGILETTEQAMSVGAKGVAYGRNIFQSKNPTLLTHAIALIVHNKYTADEAIKETKINI